MCWPCLYAIIVFSRGNCLSCVGPVNILSLSSPEGIVYHVLALFIFFHWLLLRELFMCCPCLYAFIVFSRGNCLSCVGPVNILSLSHPEGIVHHVLVLLIFYHCLHPRELFIMCWPSLYAIIAFSRGNCLSCVGPVNILSLSSPEGIVYHVLALLISIIVSTRGNCLSCVGTVCMLSLSSPEGIVYHVLALLIFYHCLLLKELFIMCWLC